MLRNKIVTTFAIIFITIMLNACATTKRSDYDNDCDYAKARYEEIQRSVRTYYGLGSTTVVELAAAERRLNKAKKEYEGACGMKASGDTVDLFDGVNTPPNARFTGESNCREKGKKRDYEMTAGETIEITRHYKSLLNGSGWFTSKIDRSFHGAGFRATKDGRHLNFRLGDSPQGSKFMNICVWPSVPNDDSCSEKCDK